MHPTFSPCCRSPQIADTGSTVVAIVDERAGDVLTSQVLSVFRCDECDGTFAAVLEASRPLTDADFVYERACTKGNLAIEVDFGLSGERVTRVLDQIAVLRGYPETIVLDNGSELTSLAMLGWARDRKVSPSPHRARKPVQNAFIESFNGRLRDELLNEHDFRTLEAVRRLVEAWRD